MEQNIIFVYLLRKVIQCYIFAFGKCMWISSIIILILGWYHLMASLGSNGIQVTTLT